MNKNFRETDWKRYLPIPICEEYPEYGEFYEKAWALAHDHVMEIDGMPQNPYMYVSCLEQYALLFHQKEDRWRQKRHIH